MNIINYGKLLEIVELSIDMVIFHSYVGHYQRVSTGNGTCMEMWNWITSMEGDHWKLWNIVNAYIGEPNGMGNMGGHDGEKKRWEWWFTSGKR